MANSVIHAVGTYDKIQPAIDKGTLTYPAYVFITGSNQLAFIDKDLQIQIINGGDGSGSGSGDSGGGVVHTDELPDVSEGNVDALYICDGSLYIFDGEGYSAVSISEEQVEEQITDIFEEIDEGDLAALFTS